MTLKELVLLLHSKNMLTLTQVDYVIERRRRIKEVVDTKIAVGECVVTQHRVVVSTMIVWTTLRRAPKAVKKIKWWKLKDSNVKSKYKTEVIESRILGGQQDWQKVADKMRSIARKKLGETSGKANTSNK